VAKELDWSDVQGTVLRGYRVDFARHFVLKVTDPAEARAWLGSLVGPHGSDPEITTAARWQDKPESFLNLGITFEGLRALGVPPDSLASFPRSFQWGATDPRTATLVGDVGGSSPEHWIGGLSRAADVHLILSLWAWKSADILEEESRRLRAGFAPAAFELSAHDARALPGDTVHFGYRDGIAQPYVEGAPPMKHPDPDAQPVMPAGAFLLGHVNQHGSTYRVQPEVLSTNGSFGAFRVIEQDVAGFEAFLTAGAAELGIDRELLAAKVCGRWRNGAPLSLAPDRDSQSGVAPTAINDFDYVKDDPGADDTFGYRCPLGSHIRRANPRGAAVTGGKAHLHRLIRRGMPYGPPYDPRRPDDATRGLVGFFINADLAYQFEFVMSRWMNGARFVMAKSGPGGANTVRNVSGDDVLGGVNDPATSSFTLPFPPSGDAPAFNKKLTGFSRFVHTRGGAYCFLPSITALRHLAQPPG
jgi:Dyp-type peroxidase family